MNYDIEWLFEKIYSIRKSEPSRSISFLSDWDSLAINNYEFDTLIRNIFQRSDKNAIKYSYSYEQFSLKEKISDYFAMHDVNIKSDSINISPTATTSINLVANALKEMNKKRCLLFTPAYFSLIYSLKQTEIDVCYYHLVNQNNFSIDIESVEKFIKEQFIECLILTDPIYSAGIDISENLYIELIEICNKYNIYFVIDYSLGGLLWDTTKIDLFPLNKLKLLSNAHHYVLIDSPTKRLFINGVKASLIFGDERIIDKIDRISESIYGAMNPTQLEFLSSFVQKNYKKIWIDRMVVNVNNFHCNYTLLSTVISDTNYYLANTNTGYFTYLFHYDHTLGQIDTEKYISYLLDQHNIVALTNDRLGCYSENNLGIRLNLCQNQEALVPSVIECCRLSLHSFN